MQFDVSLEGLSLFFLMIETQTKKEPAGKSDLH